MKNTILVFFLVFFINFSQVFSQSIRINEFSQGTSGSKEWVELVVSSTSTINNTNCVLAKVNIAGWILDDNNGDFSPPNHFTGSGVASGHIRFKNVQPWNNLPVGAIIVIYNAADRDPIIPSDDPLDWVNNDCVYIVPSNHTSIEYCTSLPAATSCTIRNDYGVCSYVTTGNWNNVSLANAGDGIQVRNPTFGLVHGLVYGKSTTPGISCGLNPDMVGNALAPLISNVTMSLTAASFIGTTDADYFDATKWSIIPANSATPGNYNNTNNETYIVNTLRGGCTCNRILPFEDKKDLPTQIVNDQEFTYKQIGEYIFFTSRTQATNLTLRLFSTDGRYIWGSQSIFKGSSSYRIPKGMFYLNIYAEFGYRQEISTIKISNF
jgi:hypothetical protein